MARQIYDIGVDQATRYANDKRTLDESLLEELRYVPKSSTIDVTTPFKSSELDTLWNAGIRNKPNCVYFPPVGYNARQKNLFSIQLAPSLGSEEMHQSHMQQIQEMLETSEKKLDANVPEEGKELNEERGEHEKLMNMFTKLNFHDRILVEINSKRSQYHKG